METIESLQEYGENSPYYGVNNARMRNDGNSLRKNPVVRRTLFVEGADDKKFFRTMLRDGSKWNVEIAGKKSGVLKKYEQHKKLPSDDGCTFFCADLDYEVTVDTLLGRAEQNNLVKDESFFYQLYDVKRSCGFNDMETCLFLTNAFRTVMVELDYDDDKVISSIRDKVLKIALLMGSYRVANLIVRETHDLPDRVSLLCHRHRNLVTEGDETCLDVTPENLTPSVGDAKFGVCFMEFFGLVDGRKMFCPRDEAVDDVLLLEFATEEFGEHLPELIGVASQIRVLLKSNRGARFSFLRGHDLMELLALKLWHDGKIRPKTNVQCKDQLTFGKRARVLEQLRDELESRFRLAAGESMDQIREFPIGKILK